MSTTAIYPVVNFMQQFSTASVTTAWTTVASNLSTDIIALEVFCSSGKSLELGYNAGSSSTQSLNYYVIPGGPSFRFNILLNKGHNLFMRAGPDGSSTAGLVIVNLLR